MLFATNLQDDSINKVGNPVGEGHRDIDHDLLIFELKPRAKTKLLKLRAQTNKITQIPKLKLGRLICFKYDLIGLIRVALRLCTSERKTHLHQIVMNVPPIRPMSGSTCQPVCHLVCYDCDHAIAQCGWILH